MLDAFIIDRKRRAPEEAERPSLQLPLPQDVPGQFQPTPGEATVDEPRGSVEIDHAIGADFLIP